MTETERLVKEWRDAREAFFDYCRDHTGEKDMRVPDAMWSRLGSAESALMAHARKMP